MDPPSATYCFRFCSMSDALDPKSSLPLERAAAQSTKMRSYCSISLRFSRKGSAWLA